MANLKKCLCLVLIIGFILSFTLAGCGTKFEAAVQESSAEGTYPTEPSISAGQPEATEVPKDQVTLTWTLAGNRQETDTSLVMKKVEEYLKDKLNVKINLQVYGWNDPYNQKVDTMLSSGEPLDICFTANWAANYYKNADAGYFLALNDYLDKDPTITGIIGEDFLNGCAIKGKIYAVPTKKEEVHNWGYLLKKDLVSKYRVNISSIRKMEDLEPVFDRIKASEQNVTPLLIAGGDSPFHFLDWDHISDENVPGALYPDNRSSTIINQFLAPESIAMYKKLRDYYEKGYIPKNAVTMENAVEQMKTGKFFAVASSLKPGADAEMSANTNVEWVQVDITKPVMSNRETSGALLAIPAASRNPDRAFKFIEMLYTDKTLRNMFNFGIENTHYKVDEDGRITQTQAGKERFNMGPGWRYGDQFKDLLLDSEDPGKWEKFDAYNKTGTVENSLGFIFDKADVDSEVSACKNVIMKYYRQLYCGSADVGSTVGKMESELKASGMDRLLKEMQKQFNEWRAKKGQVRF